MGARLMAIVAEGQRERVYLPPTDAMEAVARKAKPTWKPEVLLDGKCRANVSNYGLDIFGDLFTPRQLVAMTTFSDLVREARDRVQRDARIVGLSDDGSALTVDGSGASAYADAVSVYLGLSASKAADNNSTICSWMPGIKYESSEIHSPDRPYQCPGTTLNRTPLRSHREIFTSR